MTTILPPPNKKNFESEQEYNKAYKEWNKMFDSVMNNTEYQIKIMSDFTKVVIIDIFIFGSLWILV